MLDGYAKSPVLGFHKVIGGIPVFTPFTGEFVKRQPGGWDDLGYDRGAQLFLERQPITHNLQRDNLVDTGDKTGYSLTLCAAARGLSVSFRNIGSASVLIYAAPKPNWTFDPFAVDRIDDLDNATPFVLAAGAKVTLTCSENYRWQAS